MTDSTPWTPPGGSGPDGTAPTPPPPFPPPTPPAGSAPLPAAPLPPPGAPLPPPGAPQPPPGYGAAAGGPTGWTPPPKPGLIPLRPLTLGTILAASFQVLRRNPRPMFGFALLVSGAVFVVTLLVVGAMTVWAISRVSTASTQEQAALAAGSTAGVIVATLIPLALSVVALALLQGVVVLEVARGTVGEKHTLRGLLRAARGRIGALIGWALLASVAVTVAVTLAVVVIALAAIAAGPTGGPLVAVLLTLLGAAGFAVLAFWLSTRLSLVPSALVLERLPLMAALRRSWSLTVGYFWRTLGIQLLVAVILSVAANIVSTPLSLIGFFLTSLLNPNGDVDAALVWFVVVYLLTIVVSVVVGAITSVVQSATTALLYIDLRMRKEGLDLELARFVEARQAGDATVADPYASTTQAVA